MTRYGIDALTAVRLVREGIVVSTDHQLVAPQVLRSRALGIIYGEFRSGAIDKSTANEMLERLTTMRIRLLGDRMSRGTAWRIALKNGWDDTLAAEYIAVVTLQADALVTLDPDLEEKASGLVDLAPFEALLS